MPKRQLLGSSSIVFNRKFAFKDRNFKPVRWYIVLLVDITKPGHTTVLTIPTGDRLLETLINYTLRRNQLIAEALELNPNQLDLKEINAKAGRPPTIPYAGSHWQLAHAVDLGSSVRSAVEFVRLVSEDPFNKQIRGASARSTRMDTIATLKDRPQFSSGESLHSIPKFDLICQRVPYIISTNGTDK